MRGEQRGHRRAQSGLGERVGRDQQTRLGEAVEWHAVRDGVSDDRGRRHVSGGRGGDARVAEGVGRGVVRRSESRDGPQLEDLARGEVIRTSAARAR